MTQTRGVQLVSRPVGVPVASDFALVESELPPIGPDQVVVQNEWMSVDPYMRGRMGDGTSYASRYELGEVMEGRAVGTVVESRSDSLPVGTVVLHDLGWRTHALMDAGAATAIDVSRVDRTAYLGALGLTGFTAYVGLAYVAPVRPGDTVFVSGAAGGVGSVSAVVAKKLGAARVIGSAGGPDKCARLSELGYDAAIDYRAASVSRQLRAAAPDGIDVYLDNAGGDQLRVAINGMRDHGRIALCGASAQYDAAEPLPGPDNLLKAINKRLTLRGFIVFDHDDLLAEYRELATGWLEDGSLGNDFTALEGLEHAVDAFLGLRRGVNVGKMLVRLTVD